MYYDNELSDAVNKKRIDIAIEREKYIFVFPFLFLLFLI
jgi:hypothetical protein